MCDLVEKKKLDHDTMEQMRKSLADRKFFLSLELTKFAVKVAVSMNRYLSEAKVNDWLVEKDKDFSTASCAGMFGLAVRVCT